MDPTEQPGIVIGQIYLERSRFEHREDVLELPASTPFTPNLAVQFQGGVAPDEKTGFVRITVQTKAEERPLYSFEVTMTALLKTAEGQENLSLKDYIRDAAPVMLYPFVREAVAGLTWRGRFGPVWLAPFNIAAVLSSPGEETRLPSPVAKRIRRPSKRAKAHSGPR